MDFKEAMDDMISDFKLGKFDIDISYELKPEKIKILSMSFHEPYVWDNEKDPLYINFDVISQVVHLSNVTYLDLKDNVLQNFFIFPIDIGEF